jgi:S-(hydroxymethyl)glutathione dehydrogenase/alcohol dehydrogenase
VGIATIQGARIAGAARIVAVDRSQDKLELAKKFGATDIVRAKDPPATPTPDFVLGQDAVEAIMNATNGIGADYAFEVIGHPQMVEAAIAATRRGGTTIAVGVGKLSEKVRINALAFPLMGKTLAGCMFGSANPQVDFPKLLALYRSGQLDLKSMVTRTYRIDEAVQAFEDLKKGLNARGVIVFG